MSTLSLKRCYPPNHNNNNPQEPITFAVSRKEQLVKIIFDSLATAKRSATAKAAAAAADGDKENAPAAADSAGAAAALVGVELTVG